MDAFGVLNMFSKNLNKTNSFGKRLPIIGYEVTSGSEHLLEYAFQCGYRHFILDADQTVNMEMIKDACSNRNLHFAEEVFITTKVPLVNDSNPDLQHKILRALSNLQIEKIDMVLLYENDCDKSNFELWNSRWMELQTLISRGVVDYIGLCSTSTTLVDQLYMGGRGKPDIVMTPDYSTFTQKNGCKHVQRMYYDCKAKGLDFGLYFNNDSWQKKLQLLHLQTPKCNPSKVVCRSFMQMGIPYMVKSHDKEVIKDAFQVYDVSVSDANVRVVMSLL